MNHVKILIVDFKQAHISRLESLLDAADIELFAPSTLEQVLSLADEHEFALALIAAHLPVTDGLNLACKLRCVEKNKHTPIIFIASPRRAKELIFDGYEQGAVDVVMHPLEPHIVLSKVRTFVELYQSKVTIGKKLTEVRHLACAAEKANHLKSRFLANISHEIRTPLSAILGHAELLYADEPNRVEQQRHLKLILQNGRMLTEIINNVLDISKIEAGLLLVERQTFSLDEILDDVRRTFKREAEQKDLDFIIQRETPPLRISSDPTRLRQILYNVVGNAVKFTSKGGIEITASIVESEGMSPPLKLKFTIKDSGCGLSRHEAEGLFVPFSQGDPSTTRRFGGTGLGLSIARHLAQALGGDIELVATQAGRGSTFAVTIDPSPISVDTNVTETTPLAVAVNFTEQDFKSHETRLDNVRVLMVEDSKPIRSFVRRMLEASGAHVDEAEDGLQALGKVRRPDEYDIVLMDIQMPRMDGYEATRRLRERGLQAPIVAFTAHALKEERDKCLREGFDMHITKPIEHQKLVHTLAQLTKGHRLQAHSL